MSLDSDIQLLSQVKMFAGFQPDQLRLLAFGAEPRTLGQGTQLFRQDAPSDGGYVVVRGQIDLVSGEVNTLVTSLGTSALLGEMALISATNYAATAVAAQHSEVLKIPRPLFHRMLTEYPQLAVVLQKRISDSVAEFMGKLDSIRAKLDHANDIATRV